MNINQIKSPLKRRWLRVVQEMDTHLNGVCPEHIYIKRRPLESKEPYALEQRMADFEPLTKEAFDLALGKIKEICSNANIKIQTHEFINKQQIYVNETELFDYCIKDLHRQRENDPNQVLVIMPIVSDLTENETNLIGVYPKFINSTEIIEIKEKYIEFFYERRGDIDYFIIIDGGSYFLKSIDGIVPLIKTNLDVGFSYISSNLVVERISEKNKYTLLKYRLPYLYGSVAFGNKFVGQESDFSIQAKRTTFLREYRAKEKCVQSGHGMIDGVHCNLETKTTCNRCGGSGHIKDDSPLGTTFIDFDALLTGDAEKLPPLVQWSEPPQQALKHSEEIMNNYYDKMLNSLGIIKQNLTNQSGVSKSYDWKQNIKIIYSMLNDSIMLLEWFYRSLEKLKGLEPITKVYMIGELESNTYEDLLNKLYVAKQNQSPPNVIESIVDSIYLKTLNPEYSDLVVEIAKEYDILYIYGKDEITDAKAHFGSLIGIKEMVIHNTIITNIENILKEKGIIDKQKIINELDKYYAKYNNQEPII